MIRKIKKSKYLLMICLLCIMSYAQGQGFKVNAPIDRVTATGFYQIAVTPELSAYARADNADIRIAAPGGSYIPYIVRSYAQRKEVLENVSPMKILTNETDGKNTTITLEQESGTLTIGITLMMASTAVERYAQISGSNDNEHWYIIDDHILLQRANGYSKGSYSQSIFFPGNTYKYYKLKINNVHTDPLNITGAQSVRGIISTGSLPSWVENPTPAITQKDSSNHISYIVLRNSMPFMANEVILDVSGPRFYERNARIFVLPSDKDSSNIDYAIASVAVKSGGPAIFSIPGQKAQSILIEIDNKDDPPLKVIGATTRQQSQCMVAWLEKDKQYSILAGNGQATAPQYDLSRFNDSIPNQLPEIKFGKLSEKQPTATAATPKQGISGKWLWAIIIAFVIILSLLTYKLMKDAQRKNG